MKSRGLKRRRALWCRWCDRLMEDPGARSELAATRDHVHPKSRGGRWKVWACFSCNNLKGDMTPEEWAAFRQAHPQWWIIHPRRPGRKA